MDAQAYLDEAYSGGHLTRAEHDARTGFVNDAKIHEQLVTVTADLGLSLDKWLKNRRDREQAQEAARKTADDARRRQVEERERTVTAEFTTFPLETSEPGKMTGFGRFLLGLALMAWSGVWMGLLSPDVTGLIFGIPLILAGGFLTAWGVHEGDRK